MSTSTTQLTFERTIPRRLVHRDAVHEVLLTDVAELGDDRYAVACQLSRSHPLFGDRRGRHHDLLMLMEAGRQATVVIAHEFCGVSRDWAFIANEMRAEVIAKELLRDEGEPGQAVIEMSMTDPRHDADGRLRGMRFDVAVEIAGVPAAGMAGGLMFMPPEQYKALRAQIRLGKVLEMAADAPPVERLAPGQVGRFSERNVVIGRAETTQTDEPRYSAIIDQRHPSLFDHPLDHVPAIFLLEALRQSALAAASDHGLPAASAIPIRCEASFTDFAELEIPLEYAPRVTGEGGPLEVEIDVLQGDARIAEASIMLAQDER